MSENSVLKYYVDIVFCIDVTGSMEGILDKVKARALSFYGDLMDTMKGKGKHVDVVRARIVAFRDYIADGKDAMLVTDFLNLPEQSETFARCIRSITPKGGGDAPEDALEALAYAIRSDWQMTASKKRQIIVLWTDADAHPLGFGSKAPNYPDKDMPKDLAELSAWWGAAGSQGYMDKSAKRLLLYAPDKPTWRAISGSWNNIIYFPSIAGEGLQEVEYQAIIDGIANTI